MQNSDAIILGGGLAGLTLALTLDRHGLAVTVVDPIDLETTIAPQFDGRVSAIASASMQLFDVIGVGEALRRDACPIESIRVSDGLKPLHLQFNAEEAGTGPLGFMVENRHLRIALLDGARASNIQLLAPARMHSVERLDHQAVVRLENGETLEAPLLIAADGRRSPMRTAAGIRTAHWQYWHDAIVTVIDHARPHDNYAFELFYADGPFALLPMRPGTRSAVVWAVPTADTAAILDLPERALIAEINKRMGDFLGEIRLAAGIWTYPLGFHNAARITDHRLALIGDAAHGIHPIAGQGLNLGLRDVAALCEVLVEGARMGMDLGDPVLLDRYQRWRGFDTMLVAGGMDVLNRLFGIPGKTASLVRRLGIAAVNRMPPLKNRFMAEARGESGHVPRLLTGQRI